MKKVTLFIIVFLSLNISLFSASEIGLILGKPTGFSFNHYLSKQNSININLGWKFKWVNLSTDFLFNKEFSSLGSSKNSLPLFWSFGIGLQMNIADGDVEPGIRLPFGIGIRLKAAPLTFKIEFAPTMDMGDSTSLDINGGLCVRYYF